MAKSAKNRKSSRQHQSPEALLNQLRKRLRVDTMKEVERYAIHRALVASEGDVVLAAALLGIGKTTLYRYLKADKGASLRPV
jgi:transcriptional regulator of acetoin/glycerol metabolism